MQGEPGFYVREGVSMRAMTATQRAAALGLMRASLSAKGFELTRDIMRLNQTPANLDLFAANLDQATRQHIHTVLRTPNGNDYGRICSGSTT